MWGTLVPVTFRLRIVRFQLSAERVRDARWVALVSSFNRWDTSVHRLALGPDGMWSVTVELAPGTYSYLFIVDGNPYNDLEDDGRAPCEWGGEYSVRVVR